ncbi:hypothetical protein HJFPF1_05904 [Paramyrothecium foliicola]|nr:hypothetical protein HJFPF1_05904 [Paramyrothecium foliicola]
MAMDRMSRHNSSYIPLGPVSPEPPLHSVDGQPYDQPYDAHAGAYGQAPDHTSVWDPGHDPRLPLPASPRHGPHPPDQLLPGKPMPTSAPVSCSLSTTKDHTNTIRSMPRVLASWTWGFEVLSLVFGAACVAAMIVILGYMDGRALRAWRMPIEPNSLVAVFTTLAKTALMIPVASAISQMKWLWFERPRRLADLAAFDAASRGPWGAAELVVRTRGRAWVAAVASAVIVAALAFEPTAQQVISIELREAVSGNATAVLGVATNWTSASLRSEDDATGIVAFESVLIGAFNPQTRDIIPTFNCTAPLCRWEEIRTMGVCTSCAGGPYPTSQLIRNGPHNFTLVAPSNFTVGPALAESSYRNLTLQPANFRYQADAVTGSFPEDKSILSLATVNITAPSGGDNASVWIWQPDAVLDYTICRMHPCLQTFRNVTVRNGVYDAGNRTAEWLMPVDTSVPDAPGHAAYEPEQQGAEETSWSTNAFLATLLRGSTPLRTRTTSWRYQGASFDHALPRYLFENGPGVVLGSVADVLSAQMRHPDNLALQNVTGVAYEQEAYVAVTWAWMACPLAILAGAAVSLIMAMIRSAKYPLVYKDSPTALLLHGLDPAVADKWNDASSGSVGGYTAQGANRMAAGHTVRLARDASDRFKFMSTI